jgi:hypothetical protein
MEVDHSKMSVKEAREHLRELRKEHVKPVSKMGKRDVLEEIERLKVRREITPPVAATPAAPSKKMNPMVESIKEAKKMEFPVAPESESKKGGVRKTARKAYEAPTKSEVKEEMKMLEHKEEKKAKKEKKMEHKKSEKPKKGSEEMKKKMAMIRALKKKREDKK